MMASDFPNTMSPIVIESSCIRLVIRPELGGRIISLVDRRSGREWLWRNPHLKSRPAMGDESYSEHLDGGGWDEILPSVSPCLLCDGTNVPDHGDIVRLTSLVLSASASHCILSTELHSLPLRFTRELRVDGERLTMDYTLENLSERETPWIWAAHPLFALEPGMELTGTSGVVFHTAAALGNDDFFDGVIPDFHAPDFEPFSCKRFSPALVLERVGLQHPDGSEIVLDWNASEIPHLGLWLNLGAWSGCDSPPYFNLGIEPTTSAHDSLADAISAGEVMRLQPGETRRWRLGVSLRAPDQAS